MNDFGAKILKNSNGYVSTFWFLDENRIVVEKSKNFFTKFFALHWSRRQILKKITDEYIKEK
jgi:hypothetical protein